jgi:hypothetical protein
MTPDTPNWDLLARDPARFFDLNGDWERRDLRRAYGRWIKRFKPDAHPDEFRKIRAGFERLEDELRFERLDGDTPATPEPPASALDEDTRPEQSELVDAIAERGPAAVLLQLREDFPLWWVPNYLRLFVDGDGAASDEVFERQLVAALRQRPREPVLLNLMRSWVRRRGTAGDRLALFDALRALPDMTLAVVATPLMKEAAAAGRGDVLEAELMRLEGATHQEGRAAFAAVLEECLLAAAMVLDPPLVDRWLDEIALDRHGRFDVEEAHAEAASRILQWRSLRGGEDESPGPKGGMVRELEEALLQLAVGDDSVRLGVLVSLGQRVRSATDEICGQFKPYDQATYALVEGLSIFGLPLDEAARLGGADHLQALDATHAFLEEMNERTEGSVLARIWTLLPLMAWTVAAVSFGLLVSPLTALFEAYFPAASSVSEASAGQPVPSEFGWLAPLIGAGITILVQVARRDRAEPLWVITRALRWTERRISLVLYRTLWRRRLIEFASLQPWSGQQLASVLGELQQGDGSTVAEEIAEHLARDPALVLVLFGRDLDA